MLLSCPGLSQAQAVNALAENAIFQIDAGGSLRLRYEWKRNFSLAVPASVNPQDYLLSQLRLHVRVRYKDRWSIYLEGQDARVNRALLNNTVNDRKSANTFADAFDLHQGFVDVNLFDINMGETYGGRLRIGRQKFNLGAQRMLASLEWVNTARVWDAIRYTQFLGASKRKVDVWASRLVAVRPHGFNHHGRSGNRMFDSRFYGIYFSDAESIRQTHIETYYLQRDNQHVGDRTHTFGLRLAWQGELWDADGEAMGQTGSFAFLTHRAYALHAGAGRKIGDTVHISMAYNTGSGDKNSADTRHQTFDNLYPLNHAYYGYMDFFSLQNMRNAEAVLRWHANENSMFRLAYQGFWLAQAGSDAWYNAGGGVVRNVANPSSAYVGSEIDATLSTKIKQWSVNFLLGYSHFFAGGYVRSSSPSADADFIFLQSKWQF
ncbi:MAG: alginate export family protein [Mariprofundaceae bacterium]|nr:alginate export family protein [Mariprofundaceae bacterium]